MRLWRGQNRARQGRGGWDEGERGRFRALSGLRHEVEGACSKTREGGRVDGGGPRIVSCLMDPLHCPRRCGGGGHGNPAGGWPGGAAGALGRGEGRGSRGAGGWGPREATGGLRVGWVEWVGGPSGAAGAAGRIARRGGWRVCRGGRGGAAAAGLCGGDTALRRSAGCEIARVAGPQ